MADTRNPEKSIDVPPQGDRNPDPITDAPGSHPVETGIGAAIGGAASGMAVGSVAGPIGTAAGAVLGAVAGGYAGKGIGELIDPTTEDNWLRENYRSRPYARQDEDFDTYVPAYKYGATAESQYGEGRFDEIEDDLRSGWEGEMEWERAREPVRDAYDRCCEIRRQRTVAR